MMVVQYCRTYTDREHGKLLTYGSYGPYELNNGFTDRANRTVREKDLRIVNIVFNR